MQHNEIDAICPQGMSRVLLWKYCKKWYTEKLLARVSTTLSKFLLFSLPKIDCMQYSNLLLQLKIEFAGRNLFCNLIYCIYLQVARSTASVPPRLKRTGLCSIMVTPWSGTICSSFSLCTACSPSRSNGVQSVASWPLSSTSSWWPQSPRTPTISSRR